jgi:hypothetical protein
MGNCVTRVTKPQPAATHGPVVRQPGTPRRGVPDPAPVPPASSAGLSHISVSRPPPAHLTTPAPSGGSTQSETAPGQTDESPGLIGGFFDTLRDIGNVISTGAGNAIGEVAALATGLDIDTADTAAGVWSPHGQFLWHITWNMSGRNAGAATNGWLVQHVENSYQGEDSAGRDITTARVGATPSYYEAWPVIAGVVQQPWGGASDDTWGRPNLATWPSVADAATKGRWSMVSEAHFTTTNPTAHGLAPHNVADAGDLPSAVAPPPDLGVARLHRYANGTWDSTGAVHSHSGGHR